MITWISHCIHTKKLCPNWRKPISSVAFIQQNLNKGHLYFQSISSVSNITIYMLWGDHILNFWWSLPPPKLPLAEAWAGWSYKGLSNLQEPCIYNFWSDGIGSQAVWMTLFKHLIPSISYFLLNTMYLWCSSAWMMLSSTSKRKLQFKFEMNISCPQSHYLIAPESMP